MEQTLGYQWWIIMGVVGLVGAIFSLLFTPACKLISIKIDLVDRPKNEAHKLHRKITPLLGGLSMFGAWVVTLLSAFLFALLLPEGWLPSPVYSALKNLKETAAHLPMLWLILGGFLAMLLGLLDDKYALKASYKLLGQILIAALTIYFANVYIKIPTFPIYVSWIITLFWFVLVFNAINFFDNMDGLAVGTSCIALSLFTIVSLMTGQYFIAGVAVSAAGAALGFWFYNHSPASIFMGDSGSHFLAFVLAVVAVKITYITPDSRSYFPLLIPLFIMAMPLFDVGAVVLIRLKKNLPIYKGDHNHISHRFVAMGMNRLQAVLAVHLLALIVGLSVLPLLTANRLITSIIISQVVALLLLISLLQYHARNEK